jgi:hypothetical protein
MDLEMIKKEYEAKQQKLYDELYDFIECAVNYDELIDTYETKENIDTYELEWNDAMDQRHYDILDRKFWIVKHIISRIDEINDIGDDKKKLHRVKRDLGSLVTELRRMKKDSNEFIEQEQQMINYVDAAIGTLDEMRGK